MRFCKSISFCFNFGFAGIIAKAVIMSLVLVIAYIIESLTVPMFMDQLMAHEMFTTLCVFLLLSWLLSPVALCCFRKAMDIAQCKDSYCSVSLCDKEESCLVDASDDSINVEPKNKPRQVRKKA